MRSVWIAGEAMVSSLGKSAEENYKRMKGGESGLRELRGSAWSKTPITVGEIENAYNGSSLTRFESVCCTALEQLLHEVDFPVSQTLLILSSTKGNIELLENGDAGDPRLSLHSTAAFLGKRFGFHAHMVVSNACISGILAMAVARRFLQQRKFEHAVVLGADVLSRFVVSGFQSLQALTDTHCRPFDSRRNGINLGEASGALLLTARPDVFKEMPRVKISGTAMSNDANHISGPSRTGEELSSAIGSALREAGIGPSDIDFISAHGTATLFNDEMEARAFNLAGLQKTPLNSLKGYFGHTLGAAGVIESIISVHGLLQNELMPTKGFETSGVSQEIHVIRDVTSSQVNACLKTGSGFGGCNAAIIFEKV